MVGPTTPVRFPRAHTQAYSVGITLDLSGQFFQRAEPPLVPDPVPELDHGSLPVKIVAEVQEVRF